MKTPQQSEAAFAFGMAMHACLASLAHQLATAQACAVQARNAMEQNERNLAIGTVMPLEQMLPECETLYRAVFALQAWRNRLPHAQEDGAL